MEEQRKKQDDDAKKKKALTTKTHQFGGVQQRVTSHPAHTLTHLFKGRLFACQAVSPIIRCTTAI